MPEIETSGALLEVARSLRPRILAERDRIEASRRLPDDIARELAHAGFFRIFLPAAYGGLDLTPMEGLEIFEELARADASVAWCVWNGNTHWTAAQLSPEAARTIHNDPDVITAKQYAYLGAGPGRPRWIPREWPMVPGQRLRTRHLDGPSVRRPPRWQAAHDADRNA
jgi:hypothetical protein